MWIRSHLRWELEAAPVGLLPWQRPRQASFTPWKAGPCCQQQRGDGWVGWQGVPSTLPSRAGPAGSRLRAASMTQRQGKAEKPQGAELGSNSQQSSEHSLGSWEEKPVNPKGNQPWTWSWSWSSNPVATWCEDLSHWKRLWCWERLRTGREGVTKGEMVGWHHWLSGHEFEQAPRDSEGQGSPACCSPWGHKELDTV